MLARPRFEPKARSRPAGDKDGEGDAPKRKRKDRGERGGGHKGSALGVAGSGCDALLGNQAEQPAPLPPPPQQPQHPQPTGGAGGGGDKADKSDAKGAATSGATVTMGGVPSYVDPAASPHVASLLQSRGDGKTPLSLLHEFSSRRALSLAFQEDHGEGPAAGPFSVTASLADRAGRACGGAVGTWRSKQDAKQLAAALCIDDVLAKGLATAADFQQCGSQKRKVRRRRASCVRVLCASKVRERGDEHAWVTVSQVGGGAPSAAGGKRPFAQSGGNGNGRDGVRQRTAVGGFHGGARGPMDIGVQMAHMNHLAMGMGMGGMGMEQQMVALHAMQQQQRSQMEMQHMMMMQGHMQGGMMMGGMMQGMGPNLGARGANPFGGGGFW